MRKVRLPHGVSTSQLGFGCTVLKAVRGGSSDLALLNEAFEHGIRHFDVAPSYGLGVSEAIVGEFLRTHRSEVTVTTKVGIPRPRRPGTLARLRRAMRPFVTSPKLRAFLGTSAQRFSGAGSTRFDLGHVENSVVESLRHLRTDYVDVLLLHEITPSQVSDELLKFLEQGVRRGMFLAYGVGGDRLQSAAAVTAFPTLGSVVQTSWSVGEPYVEVPRSTLLSTFGSIRPSTNLAKRISADPKLGARLSAAVNTDLHEPGALPELMAAAAFAANREGLILLSTSNIERIRRNAQIASDGSLHDRGLLLHHALISEGIRVPTD